MLIGVHERLTSNDDQHLQPKRAIMSNWQLHRRNILHSDSARHRASFNPCYSTLPRIIVTTKWMREEYLLCY
ncbi:hypothetical protein T06_7783 [Trichinella sp. T6]|nr:hypothetical protein T06_7783 [Trichinella sp. T6]